MVNTSERSNSVFLLRRRDDLTRVSRAKPIVEGEFRGTEFCLGHQGGALWLAARFRQRGGFAFCLADDFGDRTHGLEVVQTSDRKTSVQLLANAGEYAVTLELPSAAQPVLHWRTTFRPKADVVVPAWPRDVMPIDTDYDPTKTEGTLHAVQQGITGNLLYASLDGPDPADRGSLLYVQNLGAMTAFFEQTQQSAAALIGGTWPELGLRLPASPDKPLRGDQEYVLSEAYVRLDQRVPADDIETARLFLELFSDIYLRFPRPTPVHRDWPRRVGESVRDLSHSPECGVDVEGNRYVLAYAGSTDRPPESMVQLAVLLPLHEYAETYQLDIPLIGALERNLPTFFDEDLGTIARWLPAQYDKLQGQEEHMTPRVMDSWYLLHTCSNLGRLANKGAKWARDLFLPSVEYSIRAAHRFDYRWPVFYDAKTFDVIKADTKPGSGGEHDVGALYAHVMLTAYDLTGEQRFIDEAVEAAKRLRGLGFNLGYQSNNVSFGAGALQRLWKLTGDEQYRGLAEVCWANIIRNLWLWDCQYGNARHYSTFMGLAPLQDAAYLALYEELEVLAAIHEYVRVAGDEISPPLRLLLPEYCKYLIDRAWFHYPSELPLDVLAEKPQSGNLHRYLSVPVEDLSEGWEKAGKVGQEVYGAAGPFIIVTRHCHHIPNEDFILHCNYPVSAFEASKGKTGGTSRMTLAGDERAAGCIRLVAQDYGALPRFTVKVSGEGKASAREVEGSLSPLGYYEYEVHGNAEVEVKWDKRVRSLGETQVAKHPTRVRAKSPRALRTKPAKSGSDKAKK